MKLIIPNLKEIMKPEAAHEPGYGINAYTGKFIKQKILEQGSTPKDRNLLKKLGIDKKERVLAIAGYYASWASAIARLGVKVDYSDISGSMVKWVKKKYGNLFERYICSNYELIPKHEEEYDWTFTYEACGGKRGLSIAYLRSLLNTKGGILVLLIRKDAPEKMGSKLKQYPKIVRTISKLYNCKSIVKIIKIKGYRKAQESSMLENQISKIITNKKSRKLAEQDLEVLQEIQKRKSIGKKLMPSLKRLNKLTIACIDKRFHKSIKVR